MILKMHNLITEDVFRRVYPLQAEINDPLLPRKVKSDSKQFPFITST